MKIFVINMDKSVDRWKRISKELDGLDFHRFPAIEGKKLSQTEIDTNTTFLSRTFLCTYGSLGCALSHINLWREIADSDQDFACIAEDDATFTNDFKKVLGDIPSIYSKTDFDILNLYSDFLTSGSTIYANKSYKVEKPRFALSMCCYVIGKKGAKALVELSKKVLVAIDIQVALLNFNGLINQCVLYTPKVAQPSLEESTINKFNTGGILNRIISILPDSNAYKKFSSINLINFNLKYTITSYIGILIFLAVLSLSKKWYILFVIIVAEILMVLTNF
jgi:glycosyl transferase family 25